MMKVILRVKMHKTNETYFFVRNVAYAAHLAARGLKILFLSLSLPTMEQFIITIQPKGICLLLHKVIITGILFQSSGGEGLSFA